MSKGLGKAIHCDRCNWTLLDYKGHATHGSVLCESIICGAGHVVLCKSCSLLEFEEEEKAGTNNIPHLLKLYGEKPCPQKKN